MDLVESRTGVEASFGALFDAHFDRLVRNLSVVAPLLVDPYRPVPGRAYRVVVFDRHGEPIAVHDGELHGN